MRSSGLFAILLLLFFFFFFNDTATTEIYTLSLHDALPIYSWRSAWSLPSSSCCCPTPAIDRKSTRLNSSHDQISYAVFCLKKKKKAQLAVLVLAYAFGVTDTCAAATVTTVEVGSERTFRTIVIFFFNDTATTEIYTLSLHDALPISSSTSATVRPAMRGAGLASSWA